MTPEVYDCIVVGSGPAGAMCAQTLVEAGKHVLLIDAGRIEEETPEWRNDFYNIRKNSNDQQSIFLGNKMELLNLKSDDRFGQMTPQRSYVAGEAGSLLPVVANEFALLESLSTGGLGNAWGLGCFTFSDAELLKAKLNPQQIREAYDVIVRRIGISYSADDISTYAANGLMSLQPGINVDSNAEAILKYYHRKRKQINSQSFYAGVPPLALLTQPKDGREATDYSNMDFYYNFGDAAYRPTLTIKKLQSQPNFHHQQGVLVTRFDEKDSFVEVSGMHIISRHPAVFHGKKVVLACNVLGTARIALRSNGYPRAKVPILCNPFSMLSTLQISQLGKVPSFKKTSTVQVSLFHDKDGQHTYVPMASLYSYSSLLLFRLLKKSPLNFRDSLRIMKYLQSAIVIAGIHHPSFQDDSRYAYLESDDTLHIVYPALPAEKLRIRQTEKKFAHIMRQLGCMPFKKISPPHGASAHYAGTLPFSDNNIPLSLSRQGLLSGTKNVFVADASGFHYLPAKGPTLTIMANAHNVALNIIASDK